MKNFLLGFLLAIVGCLISLVVLIVNLYDNYKEDKKHWGNHDDCYIDYSKVRYNNEDK